VEGQNEIFRAPNDDIPNGCTLKNDIIFFRENERIVAAPNRCRHQGGTFQLKDDCLVCPRHNWRLDPQTMCYVSPTGMPHPTFDVQQVGPEIIVGASTNSHPWTVQARSPARLRKGELSIRFLAHACVEVRCGSVKIFTDPWLVGPAFSRGWWLAHLPPDDWLETLSEATAVYISHNHSDHLSQHTLRKLSDVRPDIPIYVPRFGSESCERLAREAGLENVISAPFDEWLTLDKDTRIMILRDAAGREDSGILIDYRGHLILNTVDCANLNDGVLPTEVDVLLSSFAGGASGYPVCWSELYSVAEIKRLLSRVRAAELVRIDKIVRSVQPKIFIPFAGYFTEAHPSDAAVRDLNVKNSPQRAIKVAEKNRGTRGWLPVAGGILDLADASVTGEDLPPRTNWDDEFSTYIPPIDASLNFVELHNLEGIKRYFDWVGYSGDLVLHVIETEEDFEFRIREFFVDFRSGSVSEDLPSGEFRYLRMTVRATSFRHVLRTGQPWEELSIGFQARFYRNPNQYNFDFWNHLQNALSVGSPWNQSP